tara:strand:+ start:137 stop:331 length:195 start_codon:yes stop_codon:yes gene_type:complete
MPTIFKVVSLLRDGLKQMTFSFDIIGMNTLGISLLKLRAIRGFVQTVIKVRQKLIMQNVKELEV